MKEYIKEFKGIRWPKWFKKETGETTVWDAFVRVFGFVACVSLFFVLCSLVFALFNLSVTNPNKVMKVIILLLSIAVIVLTLFQTETKQKDFYKKERGIDYYLPKVTLGVLVVWFIVMVI